MSHSLTLQLLVLTSIFSIYVYGSGLRCKAVAGCEIARCDPSPFSWGHLERNEFPITCVSDGAHRDQNDGGNVANLNKEIERLWEMNRLQNDKLDEMQDTTEDIQKLHKMDIHLLNTVTGIRTGMEEIKELRKETDYLKATVNKIQQDSKEIGDLITRFKSQLEAILLMFNAGEPTPAKSLIPTSRPTTQRTANIQRKGCRLDEFQYGNVCYWFDMRSVYSVRYSDAEAMCRTKNSALAYPVNRHHFQLVKRKAQELLSNEVPLIRVWTGIRQDPETGKLFVRGSSTPYVQWANREPDRNPTDTRVMMWLVKDFLNSDGLYDAKPSTFGDGAFCMYTSV